MKKTTLLIAATCIMVAAASCQKEQAVEKESAIASKGILTVTADIAQFAPVATKTSIKGSATIPQPVWSEGDKIMLFNTAGESAIYEVDEGVGKSSATFFPEGSSLSGTFACAYYPAENATSYTEGTGITATIPATQAYTAAVSGDSGTNAGTFALGSFPMVGKEGNEGLDEDTGNLNLTFKNVFGLLQLNFTGSETIKQIDLIGSANLSGTATITTTGTPSCTISSGVKYVTLTDINTALTSTSKAFYIAVPAGTSNISKIAVTTTGGSYNKSTTQTIARSEILSLNAIALSDMTSGAIYPEAPDKSPVTIGSVTWAPVNCGYDASHTYGLLYQWGRKVGGGYDSTEGMQTTTAVEYNNGYYKELDDTKFYIANNYPSDWYANSTSKQLKSWPMKSGDKGYVEGKIANPCPSGWRVPTDAELTALLGGNYEPSLVKVNNQMGCWFNGTSSASNGVFLQAAGYRDNEGAAGYRGTSGEYWSSSVSSSKAYHLGFNEYNSADIFANTERAFGQSVRCVKE